MFQLRIERVFCAAHAMIMAGRRETTHGHNWRVRVVVEGPRLDDDGLLCDFHLLERRLDAILAPWDGRDLNATPPFDRVNPSAEHVALEIARAMAAELPPGVILHRVSVTEAPGCEATVLWPPGRE
jgi:6-pyruvoyltetrahydropterin/6-carboxytetrahydropterin synthase